MLGTAVVLKGLSFPTALYAVQFVHSILSVYPSV